MSTGFGIAASVLAFPLGAGLFVWFVGLATAAEINARARLLEAQNAAKPAPLPSPRSDDGGQDGPQA